MRERGREGGRERKQRGGRRGEGERNFNVSLNTSLEFRYILYVFGKVFTRIAGFKGFVENILQMQVCMPLLYNYKILFSQLIIPNLKFIAKFMKLKICVKHNIKSHLQQAQMAGFPCGTRM